LTPAISFFVRHETQQEIDVQQDKLGADNEGQESSRWVKYKFSL